MENSGQAPQRRPRTEQRRNGHRRSDGHRVGSEQQKQLRQPDRRRAGSSARAGRSRSPRRIRFEREPHRLRLGGSPGGIAGVKQGQKSRTGGKQQKTVELFPVEFHSGLK